MVLIVRSIDRRNVGWKALLRAQGFTHRQLRVGEAVRRALSQIFLRGDIQDGVVSQHIVMLNEVQMSSDLRLARAYVTKVGGGDATQIVEALNNQHSRYLRFRVAQMVSLKYVPQLSFYKDDSLDNATAIDALLCSPKVRQDTGSGR